MRIRVIGQGYKTLDSNNPASVFQNKRVSSILSAEQGMLTTDVETCQLWSAIQGLGAKSFAYSSKRDFEFCIYCFTGGCKVSNA
jgi:hypothetical protein